MANRLTQTTKKQFHFRKQPLTTKRPTYFKPSTWIPPEQNFTNLTLLLKQTQNFPKPRSNPDLVIKPFDKGSEICLIDTSLYISKTEDRLADPSTYKEHSSNSTQAIINDILSTFNYLYNTHCIDDVARQHLT